MTPEEEHDYIITITTAEHTRIADAEHERQRRQHAELKQQGLRLQGLETAEPRDLS